jgi:hypothetical protein
MEIFFKIFLVGLAWVDIWPPKKFSSKFKPTLLLGVLYYAFLFEGVNAYRAGGRKNGSAGGGECDPCINIGEEAPH